MRCWLRWPGGRLAARALAVNRHRRSVFDVGGMDGAARGRNDHSTRYLRKYSDMNAVDDDLGDLAILAAIYRTGMAVLDHGPHVPGACASSARHLGTRAQVRA